MPKIPQLAGSPILGNLFDFRYSRLDLLIRVSSECGDVGAFRIGRKHVVLLNAADMVHKVLVDHGYDVQKPRLLRRLLRSILGEGLLNAEGDTHRSQRKILAPPFQHRNIAQYANIITEYAYQQQSTWNDQCVIDVVNEMQNLTLRIIGKILFDVDILHGVEDLREILAKLTDIANKKLSEFIPVPLTWPTPSNIQSRILIDKLSKYIRQNIKNRQEALDHFNDILSILLNVRFDDGSTLSDAQIRDEIITLFLAGQETIALAVSWSWYFLAQNAHIYKNMQGELAHALNGRVPTVEDLPKLPYTLQVLKEALRIYPPAYLMARRTMCSIDLPRGYYLPAGTTILISPYTLHRRSEYFPLPTVFNPDRFAPDAERTIPKGAYIPFSLGPRTCLGNHLALMEGHLILATIGQNMTFEALQDQQIVLEPLFSLRPKHGIHLRVQRNESLSASPSCPSVNTLKQHNERGIE